MNLTTSVVTNATIENAITCRCCGGQMEHHVYPAHEQINGAGQVKVWPARLELTCWNPDCQMNGYTQDAREYAHVDLALYIKAVQS